jgi:hypothetical protein
MAAPRQTSSGNGRRCATRDAGGASWTQTYENLAAFEETFTRLEGFADEHVTTLRRASSTRGGASRYPLGDDPLAQAAYTAAALRGLAEAVAALQGNETKPTMSASK